MKVLNRQSADRLSWQSQLVLFLTVVLASAGFALQGVWFLLTGPRCVVQACALGVLLAAITWRLRVATIAAAITGGLFTAALYLATPGWQTALWPLLALLLLTLAATRFGRASKEKLGVAEARRGRTASQVAANLGVAVLASLPLGISHFFALPLILNGNAMKMALIAALAEAAADTLSSEFGEVLGGEPLLLTTLRPVPAGTDGAISISGTLAGVVGAAAVTLAGSYALGLSPTQAALVALAAIVGLFVDSLLGALFERRGWLNNDAVNFLSGLTAALVAWLVGIHS